jgi:hypothetical protein
MIYIAKETLSSTAASITFSNIAQNYKHLCVKISARQGVENAYGIRLNGDTGNNYNYQLLGSDGSNVTHSNSTGTSEIIARGINPSNSTASIFGNTEFYIFNYADTSYQKTVSVEGVNETNAVEIYQSMGGGNISGTSAITSITVRARDGNLQVYSTFYLYGLK